MVSLFPPKNIDIFFFFLHGNILYASVNHFKFEPTTYLLELDWHDWNIVDRAIKSQLR